MGARGHTRSHPAVTATLPPVTLQPLPAQGPAPRAPSSLPCGVTVGRGVHKGRGAGARPQASTRPCGPQEMAVLCHGRCLLLTLGTGTSLGPSWLVGDRPHRLPWQVPRLSPCPWPWLTVAITPGGACTHPQHGSPSPTTNCVRALASGSSCWHMQEEWGRGAGGVPWVPPATPWLPPRQCLAVIPSPRQACPGGTSQLQNPLPGRDVQAVPSHGLAEGTGKAGSCAVGAAIHPIALEWASRAMGQSQAWDMVTLMGCWLVAMWAECWGCCGAAPVPIAWSCPCPHHCGAAPPCCAGRAVLQQCTWADFGGGNAPHLGTSKPLCPTAHQCQPRRIPGDTHPECLCPTVRPPRCSGSSGGDDPHRAVGKLRHGASRGGRGTDTAPRCRQLLPPPRRRHGPRRQRHFLPPWSRAARGPSSSEGSRFPAAAAARHSALDPRERPQAEMGPRAAPLLPLLLALLGHPGEWGGGVGPRDGTPGTAPSAGPAGDSIPERPGLAGERGASGSPGTLTGP